ncbi:hypothetical protein F5890DRAFT_1655110 [Lentinula detonsa]|uniref:Uncharacterized protein n=1 Tax=Lentinula detonsa TaxID=2804962 RepID=A0AA38PN34_9AGAR|nr:hypothetical protein F5890DRAFT_1655110 [Lentinula detonsa]
MLTGGWSRDCEHFTFFLTFFLTFHYPLSPPSKTPNGATDKPRFQKFRPAIKDDKRVHVGLICNISRTLHPFTQNNGSAGWKINWDMIGVAKVLRLQEFGRLISETNELVDSFAAIPACYTPQAIPVANESTFDSFAAFPARYTPQAFPAANESTFDSFVAAFDSFAAIPARYTPQAFPAANESTLDSFAAFLAHYTPQAFPAANESTLDSFAAAFDSFVRLAFPAAFPAHYTPQAFNAATFPARYTPQAFPAANESTFDSFAAVFNSFVRLVCSISCTLHPTGIPCSKRVHRLVCSTSFTHSFAAPPSPTRPTANKSALDSFAASYPRATPYLSPSTFDSLSRPTKQNGCPSLMRLNPLSMSCIDFFMQRRFVLTMLVMFEPLYQIIIVVLVQLLIVQVWDP